MMAGMHIYAVERGEVESMEFEGIKTLIRVLERKKKSAYGSLMITFSGYENTSDEVFEIPEVRKWAEKLFNDCPHFLYFVSFGMECHKWLLPCICYDINTIMPMGARRKEIDWLLDGVPLEDRPKMRIDMKMNQDLLQYLITGLKTFGVKIGDREGTALLIKFLNENYKVVER